MKVRTPTQDRKREIVQVALLIAFKVGPAQLTTGMIAAELGLSQPAIYKHYPSKNDLMAEISQYISQCIAENIATTSHTKDAPVERLKQLVLEHLKLLREYPALPEFMILRDKNDEHINMHDTMKNTMIAFNAALEAEVKAAIAQGQFREKLNAMDATILILGVIQSLVLRMLMSRDCNVLTTDGARLLNLQLAGFMKTGEDG